jgi:hypothetical protein
VSALRVAPRGADVQFAGRAGREAGVVTGRKGRAAMRHIGSSAMLLATFMLAGCNDKADIFGGCKFEIEKILAHDTTTDEKTLKVANMIETCMLKNGYYLNVHDELCLKIAPFNTNPPMFLSQNNPACYAPRHWWLSN